MSKQNLFFLLSFLFLKRIFGSKICFNNFMPFVDENTYDPVYDCTPKYVDQFDFNEYGYATAFDKEGNAYLVRIFTINRMDSSNSPYGSFLPIETNLTTTKTSTNSSSNRSSIKSFIKTIRSMRKKAERVKKAKSS